MADSPHEKQTVTFRRIERCAISRNGYRLEFAKAAEAAGSALRRPFIIRRRSSLALPFDTYPCAPEA